MKIAVLDAAGQTGRHVVSLALEQGHSVTAIVSTPELVQQTHANLRVVTASLFSTGELTAAFREHDAVISTVRHETAVTCCGDNTVTAYTESIKAVAAAMRATHVKRLVVMTSFYTDIASSSHGGFCIRWVTVPIMKHVLTNMREMEQYLEAGAADLAWTVVRPALQLLADYPLLDEPPMVETDAMFVSLPGMSAAIPCANVAQYMLSLLEEPLASRSAGKTAAIAVQRRRDMGAQSTSLLCSLLSCSCLPLGALS